MRGRNLKKLLDAIGLLSQPTGTTIASLSKHLEINQRQAFRVIETLQQDLATPILKEKNMVGTQVRYRLDPAGVEHLSKMKVAGLNLTLPEIIALHFLKSHTALYRGTGIDENLESAFAKMEAFVPQRLVSQLEKVKTLLVASGKTGKDYEGKDQLIDDLTGAILAQKTCRVEYHSFGEDRIKKYDIDPLKFFEWNGGLYLFVRATEYEEIRVLAVERIRQLTVRAHSYQYPADFDPDSLLDGAFGLVYDDPVRVTVRFSAGQARYVKERRWAREQTIIEQQDGSILLTINSSGWFEIKKWLLSFGADAELLEPADKREELRDAIREMGDLYRG